MKKKLLPLLALLAVLLAACDLNGPVGQNYVLPDQVIVHRAVNGAVDQKLRSYNPVIEITSFTAELVEISITIETPAPLGPELLAEREELIRTLVVLSLANNGQPFPGEVIVVLNEKTNSWSIFRTYNFSITPFGTGAFPAANAAGSTPSPVGGVTIVAVANMNFNNSQNFSPVPDIRHPANGALGNGSFRIQFGGAYNAAHNRAIRFEVPTGTPLRITVWARNNGAGREGVLRTSGGAELARGGFAPTDVGGIEVWEVAAQTVGELMITADVGAISVFAIEVERQ